MMKRILFSTLPLIFLISFSAIAQQNLTLVVAGQPGQIPIVQINGKSYVDIDALARLTNSSLRIKGNQVILTPQSPTQSTPTAATERSTADGRLKLVADREQPADTDPSAPPDPQAKPAPTDQKPAALSEEAQAEALQKAVQNPVASLISVPLQNNANLGYGPFNRTQDVLEIQPVIPVKLSDKWNLITRIIQPLVWQPYPNQNSGGEYGLGDMNPSFFLSPGKPGKLIWGAGPALVIPTATSPILGQGKLSMGPSVVLLTQPPHWTLGVLANNVWSVAGSGGRPPVNQMLVQYFINYNLKNHWYLQMAPIITADWRAPDGNVWTVPVGGGVGKIMKLGFQPINWQLEFYGNAVHPIGTPSWTFRAQIAFLFPKLSPAEKKMLMEEQLKKLEQQTQPPKK